LSSKWKAKDAGSLLWERWGDEYVVFHIPSGKTHFLNAAGALVLEILGRQDSDVAHLAAEIGRRASTAVDDTLMAQIQQSLVRYEQLGLVSRCPPDVAPS